MTPAMAPRIRCWETSAAVVSIASARPTIAFCFLFWCNMFLGLVLFVSASSGSSSLFPSITGDCVDCRQYFACPAIVWVPTAMSTGLSPG
jgi:hypothetical protein